MPMNDHYAHAKFTNVTRELHMRDGSRIGLVRGVSELVSQLAADAEAALTAAAQLVDVVESGGEDEEIFSVAVTLGRDAATAVATGYQVAAALDVPDFDLDVHCVLTSPLSAVS